jgi:hypothetical protein
MAGIDKPDPDVHGTAVTSVTETVPSEADADSNRYADDVNRPPVSTNEPQTAIAQTLVAGAGAPQPHEGPNPEDWEPDGSGGAKVKEEAAPAPPARAAKKAE